ncbi:hypothetical protein HYV81_05790 [Candidatus Woesearchaeota archaeon]|nr:hypothetical protein [Candidatus Woesearchaeota archaeon]
MFEMINPYVAKIVIAARDGDSIRQISKKIRESYGWTHKWVSELVKMGAITRERQEVYVDKKNPFYKAIRRFIRGTLPSNISLNDAYLLPNLAGLDYMFTNTDAIFIWTKGGYNIGRSKDAYPIFIGIAQKDKAAWEYFFSQLGITYTFRNEKKKGIYFVLSTSTAIEKELSEQVPVLPLSETVAWAKRYEFNFQPALEMLDELYDLKIGATYKE